MPLSIKKRYLVLQNPKYDFATVINKNKKELFKIGDKIKLNDEVYVEGDRRIDVVWCDKIKSFKKT